MKKSEHPSPKKPKKSGASAHNEERESKSKPTPNEDRNTIFTETAHIPDRDQIFSESPPQEEMGSGIIEEDRDLWSGDMEEIVKGERDTNKDTVEELAEGRKTRSLLREERMYEEQRDGNKRKTIASLPDTDERPRNPYEKMSKEQLLERAHALGVPGRDRMTRRELIRHIIAARRAG